MINPMSGMRDLLDQARKEAFCDRRGKRLKFELRPGLNEKQIADFEVRLSAPIPPDARDLLSLASGFVIGIADDWPRGFNEFLVDFTGSDDSLRNAQDSLGAIPCPVYLAADDAGNGWAIDVDGATGAWGVVMYVCHDPPETVIQSEDLASFISDVLDLGRANGNSSIASMHHGEVNWDVGAPEWEFSAAEARVSNDPAIARFASNLADNFRVYDLRAQRVGMGFDWSPSMPNPLVVRDGTNLIFAIEQRPKRSSLFSRLFGRSDKAGRH